MEFIDSPIVRSMRVVPISTSASGSDWTATAYPGKFFIVYQLILASDTARTLTFKSGSTALSGAIPFTAAMRVEWIFNGVPYFKATTAGDAFTISVSGATSLAGFAVVADAVA